MQENENVFKTASVLIEEDEKALFELLKMMNQKHPLYHELVTQLEKIYSGEF